MKTRVIKRPILSEKSLQEAGDGKYTFEVEPKANKPTIAKEVERTFKVNVLQVRTNILKGKRRRVRGTFTEKKGPVIKKAVVKLAEGQKIAAFETGK